MSQIALTTTVSEDGQIVVSFGSDLYRIDPVVFTRANSARLAVLVLGLQGKLRCRCGAIFETDGARLWCAAPGKEHGL